MSPKIIIGIVAALIVAAVGGYAVAQRTNVDVSGPLPESEYADPNVTLPAVGTSPSPALPPESGGSVEPVSVPAVVKVVLDIEQKENVQEGSIQVISVEAMSWSDGCLGTGGPNEMCTQVIVPGYRIVVDVAGIRREYRTNQDGSLIIRVTPRATLE